MLYQVVYRPRAATRHRGYRRFWSSRSSAPASGSVRIGPCSDVGGNAIIAPASAWPGAAERRREECRPLGKSDDDTLDLLEGRDVSEMSRPLYITVFNVQPAGDPAGTHESTFRERLPIVKSPSLGWMAEGSRGQAVPGGLHEHRNGLQANGRSCLACSPIRCARECEALVQCQDDRRRHLLCRRRAERRPSRAVCRGETFLPEPPERCSRGAVVS